MADNVTLPVTGTGDATPKVATDQLAGGEHVQFMKLMDGTLDSSNKAIVDTSGALFTAPGKLVTSGSVWNSSTGSNATQTLLPAGGSGAPAIILQLVQTTPISAGQVTFEGSYDGSNWISLTGAQIVDPVTLAPQNSNPYVLVASTTKVLMFMTMGFQAVRMRLSTTITGAGTVTPTWVQVTTTPMFPANASGNIPVAINGVVAVQGLNNSDAPFSGAPVPIAGRASAAAPTDVSADADVVVGWFLRNGAQAVQLTAAGALIPGDATNGLKVQIASPTAFPVTDNSGSLTVDAPVATPVFVRLSDGASPITALPITDNAGSLTVDNGGTFAVQDSDKIADNAGFTDGTSKVQPMGFILDEVAGTALTENDIGTARMDSKRAQVLVIEDATTRGQRAAVSASGALAVDASGAAVPVTDNSGSLTVDAPVGTPVFVTATPSTTGGWSKWSSPKNGTSNNPLTNAAQTIKGSAGTFGGYMVYNPNATVAYLQIFDATSVTLGTTKPDIIITIPATSAANVEITNGVNMATGIMAAATTTATGNTALATAGLDVTFWYK